MVGCRSGLQGRGCKGPSLAVATTAARGVSDGGAICGFRIEDGSSRSPALTAMLVLAVLIEWRLGKPEYLRTCNPPTWVGWAAFLNMFLFFGCPFLFVLGLRREFERHHRSGVAVMALAVAAMFFAVATFVLDATIA